MTESKLSQLSSNVVRELSRLREESYGNFASKSETKRAIRFIEGKFVHAMGCLQVDEGRDRHDRDRHDKDKYQRDRHEGEETGAIISRCLVCSRGVGSQENLRPLEKSSVSLHVGQLGLERKIGMKELKKKTMELLKGDRVRVLTRVERAV